MIEYRKEFLDIIQKIYNHEYLKNLKNFTEFNIYHTETNVLAHTRLVEKNLKEILAFDYVMQPFRNKFLVVHFDEEIGNYSRAELLIIASVLHDIGKGMEYQDFDGSTKKVLVKKPNGDTMAPMACAVSSEYAEKLLKELNFNKIERSYISKIINNHLTVFGLYSSMCGSDKKDKLYKRVKDKLGDHYLDLVVHSLADRRGCVTRDDYQGLPPLLYRGKHFIDEMHFFISEIEEI